MFFFLSHITGRNKYLNYIIFLDLYEKWLHEGLQIYGVKETKAGYYIGHGEQPALIFQPLDGIIISCNYLTRIVATIFLF